MPLARQLSSLLTAPCEAAKLIIDFHRSADTQILGLQEMSIEERLEELDARIRSTEERNRHSDKILGDRDAEIKLLRDRDTDRDAEIKLLRDRDAEIKLLRDRDAAEIKLLRDRIRVLEIELEGQNCSF
jgi:hypothetical protein